MSRETYNQAVVTAARGWIGTPYHHQQSKKGIGVDCLGLVRGVWREIVGPEAVSVPTYGSSWKTGGDDLMMDGLKDHMFRVDPSPAPGRVLAFRYRAGLPSHHVAIATSASTMIHAYHKRAVMEVEITPWWMRKLAGCFEYPKLEKN